MRHVPPAHSPVALRGLLRGSAAALGVDNPRQEIEARLRERFSPRSVLLLDSGTSALALALSAAAAERPGAPVALPAYSCYDLATAAAGAGVEVVLYDLDPATLGPDPDSLREALAAGPCAVVVAPLYGVPVGTAALEGPAREGGALLVEDAAQGVGASEEGRPLGSRGSLAVLSFGRGKGLTGGGGGALLAHDARGEAALEAIRRGVETDAGGRGWRALATAAAQAALARPALYDLPASLPFLELGETIYREPTGPTGCSAAALGVLAGSWERSWEEAAIRRRRAHGLLDAWRPKSGLTPIRAPEGAVAGYLRLPFLAEPDVRSRLGTSSARRLGIMPGYPRPLSELEAMAGRRVEPPGRGPDRAFPGAEALARRLVTFPVHGRVSERDMTRLERVVRSGVG